MSFVPYYYVIEREDWLKKHRPLKLAGGLLVLGIAILTWTLSPILRYQFVEARQFGFRSFVSPVSPSWTGSKNPEQNLVDANSWFPFANPQDTIPDGVDHYSLSVPILGIKDARVEIGSQDLSKSLIHYGGTAVPGMKGTGVVFGHSILPQFYNPKNYMAIFSTLHTLHLGDTILVNYDGVAYQYQVVDIFQVAPEEISVLDQDYNDSYLSLITCTPPGTYWHRLVVKSKLVPYSGDYYEKNSRN